MALNPNICDITAVILIIIINYYYYYLTGFLMSYVIISSDAKPDNIDAKTERALFLVRADLQIDVRLFASLV